MTAIELIKHDIALLSLSRVPEERKRTYLLGIALQKGIDEKQLDAWIKEGDNGNNIPEELKQDWSMLQGKLFEEYMAENLLKTNTFVRWSNDKNAKGIIDSTASNPDLLFATKEESPKLFAVECKWHEEFNNLARIAKYADQLERYQSYQKEENIPVFIAIGYGITGKRIEKVYIVPLNFVLIERQNMTNISIDKLKPFEVNDISNIQFVDNQLFG